MKRKLLTLLTAIVTLLCAAGFPALSLGEADVTPMPTTPPNDQGKPYVLDDYDTAPVTLSQWKGTPTLLNFFTTWCPWCVKEMPDFLELQQAYGDNLRVVLVHIPSGEDEATARAFIEEQGLTELGFVEDNGFFAYMYSVSGFPYTVVIDAEGYLSSTHVGKMEPDVMRQAVEAAGAVLPEASTEE